MIKLIIQENSNIINEGELLLNIKCHKYGLLTANHMIEHTELNTYENSKIEYLYGLENFRYEHFLDFVTNVENIKGEESSKIAKKLSEEGLDTHFHVWTSETFIEHIKKAIDDKILNIEIVEHPHENKIESITVLKKL